MSAVVHLAERKEDSTLWTARDCLEAMLRDLESGEIEPDGLFIAYVEKLDNGRTKPRYYCSNMTKERSVAVLEFMKLQAMDAWTGD